MSLEDLFGSDLEDSEDEDRGKSNSAASGKAQLNELFGDSPSDEEAEVRRKKAIKQQDLDSASASEHDSERSDEDDKQEEDEKEEINKASHHQQSLTADLFGDDEELSSEEEQEKASPKADYESEKSQPDESRAAEDQIERQDILAEGEEGEEEEEEETVIDVTIPYFKVSLGSEVYFVKMPNFLSVETKPFDSALYEDEIEDDEVLDEEGNARLKLKVENTIRWRSSKDQDGSDVKESNARVVRWSDGTMSLLLGGEVFDIHKTKIDGDFNHLFVQQGTGLQAQTVFKEKLTFRPHSTASQTHRKMTLSIADRASKAQKIRILPAAGKDPEAQRQEMIKKEEERLRAQLRRESQQRRTRERGHNRGLSANYLEPDRYGEEEDDFQSLLALKKKYKRDLAQGYHGSLSDDDSLGGGLGGLESDEEEEDADRLLAAKEDKELVNEPEGSRRKRTSSEGGVTKKRKKVIVESDDEDSD